MREHKTGEDGTVTLIIPKFKNEKFGKWFLPRRKSSNFSIHLDDLGTGVWMEIDGKKPLSEIVKILEEKFKDKISPATERVPKFVSQLYAQRYISFKQLLET